MGNKSCPSLLIRYVDLAVRQRNSRQVNERREDVSRIEKEEI